MEAASQLELPGTRIVTNLGEQTGVELTYICVNNKQNRPISTALLRKYLWKYIWNSIE